MLGIPGIFSGILGDIASEVLQDTLSIDIPKEIISDILL